MPDARARRDDPWTSWAAARSLGDLAPRHAAIAHLFSQAPSGLTLEQAVTSYQGFTYGPQGQYPKQSDSSIRSRIAELVDAQVIVVTGQTRTTRAGRQARVLVLDSPPPGRQAQLWT